MSVAEILDTLLFKPLELIFEVIYTIANRNISNPGLSIVVLSLVINFLVLPLYKRADAIQEEQRNMETKLYKGVTHIKKTFSGDERMMMLQTYYRQNDYKPAYVLRSAISLFLQIPFFIAAYRFLSGLQLLNGVSFGPIPDLGRPDGILSIAGISVNVLPVLMTAINLVSCVIFTKGSPLKSQIQLYAMALFFLVFLYSSPSGLVFYWTLNNVFSLVKTIVYKLNIAEKCVSLKSKIHLRTGSDNTLADKKTFFAGGLFLSVLTGILIPSSVIKASPQEFVDITYFYHPLWFIISSFCFALGIFVIWMGVFYWLARPSARSYFGRMMWILSGIAVADYMFFGKKLGILSSRLQYENGLTFSAPDQLFNILAIATIALLFAFIYKRWKKAVSEVLIIGVLAFGVMSFINMTNIDASIKEVRKSAVSIDNTTEDMPDLTLSKTGKNVIVFMLDRGMGEYIPYLFKEKPELKKQFSGFVYYSNVISFGGFTNFGTPPLFGGYEYTPFEMNKRNKESLVSKHNEALKVMPVLFDRNGYKVTVCDPPYANYQWVPDLSIYDEYPDIQTYITKGQFTDLSAKERWVRDNTRNFFCYGILKSSPLCLQRLIYNDGKYNQAEETGKELIYSAQTMKDIHKSTGINTDFMANYNVLANLPYITDITDDNIDTFLMMANETTHEPMLLQEPDYIPAQEVDNTEYDNAHQNRFTLNGHTLKMETQNQVIHYHANMAAMLQLGKWFNYMRSNGVYDNTKIILVSDHGQYLEQLDELRLDDGTDISHYYPLLMIKDFDSSGFSTSEDFMTTADVPILATDSIISNPVNPFTGNPLNSAEKTSHDQYIFTSDEWDVEKNNGNTFLPSRWYAVHDDMRNKDNWRIVSWKESILPEE